MSRSDNHSPAHGDSNDIFRSPDGRRRSLELTRELRLPEDSALRLVQQTEEEEDQEKEIIFLEETGTWALLLPEGAVLHSHGRQEDEEVEEVLYECEPVEGIDGQMLVRCTECGLTISEAEIEVLIESLEDDTP